MSTKRFTALITGSPGTGKTTMALTAPRPIHFLDVDRKMHLISSGVDLDQVTWSQYSSTFTGKKKILIRAARDLKEPLGPDYDPRVFNEVVNEINSFIEMKENGDPLPFQTLVLDTATRLGEHLEALIKKMKGHVEISQPDWRDYLNNWIEFITGLISLSSIGNGASENPQCSCNIIVNTHDAISQDDLTKTMKILPAIPGQIAGRLGGFFQESYYLVPTIKDNRMTVDVLTHADSKYSLTSQLSDLVRVPADFRLILSGMFKGANADKWMKENEQRMGTSGGGSGGGGGDGRIGRI